jgi:hypothetical protein
MFEAPAFVAGFDDVAMMRQPIEQRGRHLGVAKNPARANRRRLELGHGFSKNGREGMCSNSNA